MAPGVPSRYRAKGSHLIQAEAWFDKQFGAGKFNQQYCEAAHTSSLVLLPGSWYDVEPLTAVVGAAATRLGRPLEDVAQEIARLNALHDLTTMYRVFLRLASPVFTLRHTPRLWSTYVEFGAARALVNEPGHYIGEGSGIPGHLLDWVCGSWRGFIPAAIEVAGGKSVIGKIISRGVGTDGQSTLQCEVKYET
jgi:hypothetical protein